VASPEGRAIFQNLGITKKKVKNSPSTFGARNTIFPFALFNEVRRECA
jgi:hypothetical protein